VGISLAVAWFYTWTATSAYQGLNFQPGDLEYYPLLVDGFLNGQLSLKYEGDPGIAKLKDPYDPVQNAPYRLLDITYYKGRYYIYFGPTPALTLLMPWKLLTGFHLPTRLGVIAFCFVGYLTSLELLLRLRRIYFPEASERSVWLGALILGLANMAPALLRRATVYELAIACAYFFVMLSFLALLRFLSGAQRPKLWLIVASAAYGLAILARPTCLYGAVIFMPVLVRLCWRRGQGMRPDARRWFAAVAIPLGAIFCGMLVYNYLRFGSPFEFGQIYQLSSKDMGKVKAFSWSYLPFNLWMYWLMPAQHSSYFPFFLNALPPKMPDGYDGLDDLYGILPNLPFVMMAGAAFCATGNRGSRRGRELGLFLGLIALWFIAVFGVFAFFSGATIRYYLDFVPALLILSCVGFWSGLRALQGRALWRRLFAVGAGGLAFISLSFAVMVSFQHADILRTFQPERYGRIARAFNSLSHCYDQIAGTRYGPLKIRLKFPVDQRGKFQPLLVSGAYPNLDYLWVLYRDDQHIQLGLEHTSRGSAVTQPIRLDYSIEHTLEVDGGFLYPPRSHPYFSGKAIEAEQSARLRVQVDGIPFIDQPALFYDPVSTTPKVGTSPQGSAFGNRFTGELREVVRTPLQRPVDLTPQAGVVEMAVVLPKDRIGLREPLVVTGTTGRGDIFYVEYLDQSHVRFVLDHWGVGAVESGPVTVTPDYIQIVEIAMGSLFPPDDKAMKNRLVVRVNGDTVLDRATAFHDVPLSTQTLGTNTIGGSTCGPAFTGKIVSVQRRKTW
jgi:hypothetical protein